MLSFKNGSLPPPNTPRSENANGPRSSATGIRRTRETVDVALRRLKNDSRALRFPSITSSSLSLISSFILPKERLLPPYRAWESSCDIDARVSYSLFALILTQNHSASDGLQSTFTNLVYLYITYQYSYLKMCFCSSVNCVVLQCKGHGFEPLATHILIKTDMDMQIMIFFNKVTYWK